MRRGRQPHQRLAERTPAGVVAASCCASSAATMRCTVVRGRSVFFAIWPRLWPLLSSASARSPRRRAKSPGVPTRSRCLRSFPDPILLACLDSPGASTTIRSDNGTASTKRNKSCTPGHQSLSALGSHTLLAVATLTIMVGCVIVLGCPPSPRNWASGPAAAGWSRCPRWGGAVRPGRRPADGTGRIAARADVGLFLYGLLGAAARTCAPG